MSAEREELMRVVLDLPEAEVPAVLAEARRHLHVVPEIKDRPWPPAFFGAGATNRTDIAAHHDDLLAEGFGRD